jgi:acyl-CoA thioesterase-2
VELTETLSLEHLYELLTLTPAQPENLGDEPGRPCREYFLGRPQEHPSDRVFGGLLLAQSMVAAGGTVPTAHQPLSMQAEFLLGVPTDQPLRWEVEHVGDARSLSTRRATLLGEDGPRFSATSRWGTVRDDLPSYDAVRPAAVPGPDELPDLEDRFGGVSGVPTWWRMRRPVLFRHVQEPPYTAPGERGDRQTVWVRARGTVPESPIVRAALLAYVTDMSILETAFRAVGSFRHGPDSRILSLSHTLVFHAPCDLGAWHQFDSACRTIAHGRAFATGEIFDAGGRHVASATQVGLTKFS